MDYYKDISFEQLKEVFEGFPENSMDLQTEKVGVYDLKGRVLGQSVYANEDIPTYSYSLLDGFALDVEDIEKKGYIYKIGKHKKVNKGEYIEDKYNAVIDKKDVIFKDSLLYINKMPNRFEGIRYKGEDRKKGSFLYAKDTLIDAEKMIVMLENRVDEAFVYKKFNVGLVLTLNNDKYLSDKKKYAVDTISLYLKDKLENERVSVNIYKYQREDKRTLQRDIKQACLKNDMVIVIGKTGNGQNDHTYDILNKLGDVYIKGLRTIPAKNFMFGNILGSNVFAFPADILSCMFLYENFIKDYISSLTKVKQNKQQKINARLLEDVESDFYYKEFVYVNIFNTTGGYRALPVKSKDCSNYELFATDGYFTIDENVKNLRRGDYVKVTMSKPLNKTNNNVLFVAKKNVFNSKIIQYAKKNSLRVIQNTNINSLKGSIYSKEYVLGEFEGKNEHFKDELENGKIIIQGVKERYGLAINKKYLEVDGLEDLVGKNIKFANLPRNNYSRIMLEQLLKNKNISPDSIKGFEENIYKNETVLFDALLKDKFDVCFISERQITNHNVKFVLIATKENDFVLNTKDEELINKISLIFSDQSLKEELSMEYDTQNFGSILRKKN